MNPLVEDQYLVFTQRHQPDPEPRRVIEREVVSCDTYEEARRVRREFLATGRSCVIRYVGPAGGGD